MKYSGGVRCWRRQHNDNEGQNKYFTQSEIELILIIPSYSKCEYGQYKQARAYACMLYLFETAVPVTGPSSGVGHAIRPSSLSTAACTW